MLTGLWPAVILPLTANGQTTPTVTDNFHAAVNGTFVLCPSMVRTGKIPSDADAKRYGFAPITSPIAGQYRFRGLAKDGELEIWFDASPARCTVNYMGGGYVQIAAVARDMVVKNGLARITGDDTSTIKGDVFEGPAPTGNVRARFTIIENGTSKTAAISYTEKAQ